MLLTKTVMIKWHGSNKKYYKSKGYICTKISDEFEVRVEDLSKGSPVKVEVKCDCEDCKNPYLKPMKWKDYLNSVKEGGKYYCNICVKKVIGSEKSRKTKLSKSKSFEQWCYDNLSKEESEDILSRWDCEKNIDKDGNVVKPSEIGFSSNGFNKKGYWFKCLKHPEHKSELKSISRFTSGREGSILCNQCNSFVQWGIDNVCEDFLKKYWSDKNIINPWEISYSSGKDVWIKCQNKDKPYHNVYKIRVDHFFKDVRCPYCSNMKIHPLDSLGKLLEGKGLLHLWSDKNKKSPFEYAPKSTKEVWWKCPDRTHEDFKRSAVNSNKSDFRCPSCQFSKGEKRIEEYLINNKIQYISQQKYEGLVGVNGGNLSYDFYLPKYNLLIEYQGEQHEKYIRGFHKSKKDFEKQVEHDRRKREYADKNKINLLPIWYWEFDNIEEILDRELNKNNTYNKKQCIHIETIKQVVNT